MCPSLVTGNSRHGVRGGPELSSVFDTELIGFKSAIGGEITSDRDGVVLFSGDDGTTLVGGDATTLEGGDVTTLIGGERTTADVGLTGGDLIGGDLIEGVFSGGDLI